VDEPGEPPSKVQVHEVAPPVEASVKLMELPVKMVVADAVKLAVSPVEHGAGFIG
jgi:hypothetical protein